MRKFLAGLAIISALMLTIAVAVWGGTYLIRYARFLGNGVALEGMTWDRHRAVLRGGNAPPQPMLSPEDAQIDAQALELAAAYAKDRNSTALLVLRRGHRVFERYFENARADTLIDAGEWSQLLLALSVGIATGERKIALVDEPAANYLAEWRAGNKSAITIRHLLANTSGLAAPAASRWPWADSVREKLGPDLRGRSLARAVRVPPGRERVPKIADATIAALVLERATGSPYLQYVSMSLWQPLGAADADVWLDGPDGAPRVDCCLRTRIVDWLRIAELLVQDGLYQGEQVVPPGWVRQLSALADGATQSGALVRTDGDYAAHDVFRVEASGRQRIWFIPSLQLAIVRTGREPDSAKGWDDATIPDLIARGTRGFVGRSAPTGDSIDPSRYAPRH